MIAQGGRSKNDPFRVLVVDDARHRDVARSMLEKMPGLVVVAEASDGAEAMPQLRFFYPHDVRGIVAAAGEYTALRDIEGCAGAPGPTQPEHIELGPISWRFSTRVRRSFRASLNGSDFLRETLITPKVVLCCYVPEAGRAHGCLFRSLALIRSQSFHLAAEHVLSCW